MNDQDETYCVLQDDKVLKSIHTELDKLRNLCKNDIKEIRDQLNKLEKSIDNIDNTVKPELNKCSSNMNTIISLFHKYYNRNNVIISYSNIFKICLVPISILIAKRLI